MPAMVAAEAVHQEEEAVGTTHERMEVMMGEVQTTDSILMVDFSMTGGPKVN